MYRSYDDPRLANNLKLSFGGSLEVLVGDPWWIHLGAEKVPDFGYEVGAGVRLRAGTQITGVTGLDLVFTKPECDGCSSPAFGIMATGGFEGRGTLALGGSIALFVVSTVLGGALYIATRPQ
jgi:hypothetical protein